MKIDLLKYSIILITAEFIISHFPRFGFQYVAVIMKYASGNGVTKRFQSQSIWYLFWWPELVILPV